MAPKPPLKPAYHHGDLPQQLVRVVRDLIETHGPDGFSVAEAARRAGVSSAAPYKHFKDRPELLRAVVSEGMDRLREGHGSRGRAAPAGGPSKPSRRSDRPMSISPARGQACSA
jgi:AcrR family transcriptional regulator